VLLRKSHGGLTSRSGGGFEGDPEALTFECLNGAPPSALGLVAVMVVAPRILVRGLAGHEVVRGDEHGVRHGDDGFLWPRCGMMRRERAAKAPLVEGTLVARAASVNAARSQRLPWRARPERCLPALSLLPGQSSAQLAECLSVGNTVMSTPNSAMMSRPK